MRTAFVLLQLLWVVPASASSLSNSFDPARAVLAATENEDENDDPTPAPSAQTAPQKSAPTADAVPGVQPSLADQQSLVAGAPLNNPNVNVHIVEKKEYSDRWISEATLYGTAQINGKFTQHLGVGLGVSFRLQENFALMALGLWNILAADSPLTAELNNKPNVEAEAATLMLLVGGVLGGFEVTPLYGKFVFYDSYLISFAIVLNAAAGAGATRHQIKPETRDPTNTVSPATYGDTGWRFLAEIGGGFRVRLMRFLTIRLELKDIVYTGRVDRVNGCNQDDLNSMNKEALAGRPVTGAMTSSGCETARFDGIENSRERSADLPLALRLVRQQSSDVLNNLGFYLGIGFTF